MNIRVLALLLAITGCGDEAAVTAPPVLRNGAAGEAGARGTEGVQGPKGDKGENGILNAKEVIGNIGATLPVTGTLATQGGRLVVSASGSAFRGATSGVMGIDVTIDGTTVASLNAFTNEVGSHKAFPQRTFVVEQLIAGMHTFAIVAQADTLTDANDFFNLTVLELR